MKKKHWFLFALLTAGVYAAVGILFALPASHVRVWRLAAWLVSAVAYSIHLSFECFHLRNPSLLGALHVSVAVALGAFGLAVGANVHSLLVGSREHYQLLLLALVAWPVLTALPAFLVALAAGRLLPRLIGKD
jgi:hypothetical protein